MPKLTEGMLRMKRDNDAPIAIPPRAGRGRARAGGWLAPTQAEPEARRTWPISYMDM